MEMNKGGGNLTDENFGAKRDLSEMENELLAASFKAGIHYILLEKIFIMNVLCTCAWSLFLFIYLF